MFPLRYPLPRSQQLHVSTLTHKALDGHETNFLPEYYPRENLPWNSVSHLVHMRGSSAHKVHTTLVTYHASALVVVATIKIFDPTKPTNQHEKQAAYCLLTAALGGLAVATFEVYVSLAFSYMYNLLFTFLHVVGTLLYTVIGGFSVAYYNHFNSWSTLLFAIVVLGVFGHIMNRIYRYQYVDEEKSPNEVHRISCINIAIEMVALVPAATAMCLLAYQFGGGKV